MIASRPPMGWNSWNTFGININETLIFQIADTMAEKGYRDAGYEYLIIDDCWSLKERDSFGNLVPDPEKFPNGMKTVADYVHSKGLKFGMYSCAGILTCAGYPSSYDHEFQDAALFAEWGIDYLKYDYCNFPKKPISDYEHGLKSHWKRNLVRCLQLGFGRKLELDALYRCPYLPLYW